MGVDGGTGSGVVQPGAGALAMGLHQEAKVRRHLPSVVDEGADRERGVPGAVDAHGAQKRVVRVGGQAMAGDQLPVHPALVDEAAPAGKSPGGGAQVDR